MGIEQTVEEIKLPNYMNTPWLTNEYIQNNAWHPVPDDWLENTPKADQVYKNYFRWDIPWKSRSEFKPGDIIIFQEFWERITEKGEYETDRFLTIEQIDIEEYERGERDLLPLGIVVHPPSQ